VTRPFKVLIAKTGLDGHTRGALIIAQALRDAGMEVIFSGIRQTAEDIVAIALREKADLIGLSCLSGAHMEYFPEVVRLLRKEQRNIPVRAGGIIPDEDIPLLLTSGVKAVFTPGTPIKTIVQYIDRKWIHNDNAVLL